MMPQPGQQPTCARASSDHQVLKQRRTPDRTLDWLGTGRTIRRPDHPLHQSWPRTSLSHSRPEAYGAAAISHVTGRWLLQHTKVLSRSQHGALYRWILDGSSLDDPCARARQSEPQPIRCCLVCTYFLHRTDETQPMRRFIIPAVAAAFLFAACGGSDDSEVVAAIAAHVGRGRVVDLGQAPASRRRRWLPAASRSLPSSLSKQCALR